MMLLVVEFTFAVIAVDIAVGGSSIICIVTVSGADSIPEVFVAVKVNESVPIYPCAEVYCTSEDPGVACVNVPP